MPLRILPFCLLSFVACAAFAGPIDWSFNHIIWTQPPTREEAAARGQEELARWEHMMGDPRFAAAVARKTAKMQEKMQEKVSKHPRTPPTPPQEGDWSYILGFATGSGHAADLPAKYQFDVNATPSCANDFVVFPTNAVTAAFTAGTPQSLAASKTGTFSALPAAGDTVTLTSNRPNVVLTASSTSNTGLNFQIGANTTVTAQNLAAAINRVGTSVGMTVPTVPNSASLTVKAVDIGTNTGLGVTETSGSFAWTGGNGALAGGAGTAGQPTIIAFNNLYSSCVTAGAVYPSVYWSYNTTGTAGAAAFAHSSPAMSLDGSQIAYVQTAGSTTGAASFVVLRWKANDGGVGTPTPLTTVTPYLGCSAPCMKRIAFSGGASDGNSDPYIDYLNDVAYLGDANGAVHKFTGVFKGEPAEVTTAPWPVTVSSGNALSPPIFDSTSGKIFIGSAAGTGAAGGGQLHAINAATGAVTSTARLSTTTSGGVAGWPLLDTLAGKIYVFVGSDNGTRVNAVCQASPCMAVYEFAVGFPANDRGIEQEIGEGRDLVTTRQLMAGSFDDAYYNSPDPANPSGSIYACGGDPGTAQRPTLWKVNITNNAISGVTQGPLLVNGNADCSPVTLFSNGANQYLFASVTASSNLGGCTTGACVFMFNLNVGSWTTSTAPTATRSVTGGTGGFIVDNIGASSSGFSQVYWATQTSPGNAVQASQAGLQ